jgi:hypothetical protein
VQETLSSKAEPRLITLSVRGCPDQGIEYCLNFEKLFSCSWLSVDQKNCHEITPVQEVQKVLGKKTVGLIRLFDLPPCSGS